MRWYQGDIAAAITDCKTNGAILLVYIKGTDDSSKQMDQIWEDSDITDRFDSTQCICLNLLVDSVEGQQFSLIYPVANVPSIFFVKPDGIVAHVIRGACSKEELSEAADETFSQEVSSSQGGLTGASAAPSSPTASSAPAGGAEASEETEQEIRANTGYSSEEKQAKIERARELIRQKQEKKAAEDKEKARNEEVDRRQLGKDMNKLKQMKADQEAKETRDALRKEKEETRIARENVKEQIQRDREARNVKYQKEKAEKSEAIRKKQQEKLAQEAEEAARIAAINSSNARIQFRLPDGSKVNETFEADEPLQSAIHFISSSAANTLGRNFRLATIYPRRVFTADDYSSTFRELSLVPTSALLVLPPAIGGDVARSSSSATGSFTALLSILLSPLLAIWGMLQSFLFSRPQQPPVQSSQQTADKSSSSAYRETASSSDTNNPRRRVGRLTDLPPGDDDQNTWNGNSTEQM